MSESPVFVLNKPTLLFDKMDARFLHPERIKTIKKMENLESNGIIKIERLSKLVKIERSKNKESIDKVLLCIELGDVEVDYGLVNLKKISIEEAGTSIVEWKGNNILFSRIRPYLNKVVFVPKFLDKGLCSAEFVVLTQLDPNLPMGYLWLVLRSHLVLNQSKHIPGGSLRPRLEDDDIADLLIPVLIDKKKISELDSKVNKALKKYYQARAKLSSSQKEFLAIIDLPAPPIPPKLFFSFTEKQSDSPRYFYRMDPLFFNHYYYERLKKILCAWKNSHSATVLELNHICLPDGIHRWKASIISQKGDIPRLGVDNITGHGILWDCSYVKPDIKKVKTIIKKNDILISSTGTGSTGRIDIYDEDLPTVTDGHVTIVRLNPEIDPYYVLSYFHTEYVKRQLLRHERGTTGQIEIYADDIGKILVPFPKNKKTINQAAKILFTQLGKIREARMLLLDCMKELESIHLQRKFGDDKFDKMKITIPKPSWRIIR